MKATTAYVQSVHYPTLPDYIKYCTSYTRMYKNSKFIHCNPEAGPRRQGPEVSRAACAVVQLLLLCKQNIKHLCCPRGTTRHSACAVYSLWIDDAAPSTAAATTNKLQLLLLLVCCIQLLLQLFEALHSHSLDLCHLLLVQVLHLLHLQLVLLLLLH